MCRSGSVALILDADFGQRLDELSQRMPVWIVDTAANRGAVERVRGTPSPFEVTAFSAGGIENADELCAAILETVELHHGEYSADPPCDVIEVIGAALSPAVRRALAKIGFGPAETRAGGFRAERIEKADTN